MILLFAFDSVSGRDKFDALYNRYHRLMLAKARDILRDEMLSEDAVSEAFIRVYKNLHKIDDPFSNSTAAFLVTIVKNTALTILKKERAIPSEELDDTARDGFNLESHVLSRLSEERIYSLLDGLGDEAKSVFLLKYAYDLSHREIGKILNMSENNVTVKLYRTRARLSELLAKEGFVHGS